MPEKAQAKVSKVFLSQRMPDDSTAAHALREARIVSSEKSANANENENENESEGKRREGKEKRREEKRRKEKRAQIRGPSGGSASRELKSLIRSSVERAPRGGRARAEDVSRQTTCAAGARAQRTA